MRSLLAGLMAFAIVPAYGQSYVVGVDTNRVTMITVRHKQDRTLQDERQQWLAENQGFFTAACAIEYVDAERSVYACKVYKIEDRAALSRLSRK